MDWNVDQILGRIFLTEWGKMDKHMPNTCMISAVENFSLFVIYYRKFGGITILFENILLIFFLIFVLINFLYLVNYLLHF